MEEKKLSFKAALPLGVQHLLAMFVAAIVPPLLIANVMNANEAITTNLIQAALFSSAVATFIQIFPIKLFKNFKTGSNLPIMMGMNYVFLGIALSVSGQYGLPTLFGGLLVASIVGIFMGMFVKYLKKFFTPLVSGILLICMGIGLFQPAVYNLAGGIGHPTFGDPVNFGIGLLVILVVVFLNKFGKAALKDTSILLAIIVGYIVSICLGIVDFSGIKEAQWLAIPRPVAYGLEFNFEIIFIMIIAYAIAIIDFMGCCTVTTIGGLDRQLETEEYSNGVIGLGIGSVLASVFGAVPVAGLTQNAAIVSLNKKINKKIFVIAAILVLLTSISPKIAALLVTIPNAVIGGATLVVFGMIATAGIMLLTMFGFDEETKLIAGVSIAISLGISSIPGLLSKFPEVIQTLVGGSSIITGVFTALFLQTIFKIVSVKKESEEKKI